MMVARVLLLVALATADKLQSNYLPPSSAQSAGGSSSFLSAPRQSGFSSSSGTAFTRSGTATSYAAPPAGPVPSGLYNTPSPRSYSTGGAPIAILRFNNENNGDGNYRFEYQTENKISQQEQGQVRNAGTDQAATAVHGSYTYESPEGQSISVTYVADENGFRAAGDHIPTPPTAPAAIQKSLQTNTRTSGYGSSSSSFSGGFSSSSSFGGSQPQVNRQYLAPNPSTQSGGGYSY